MSRKGLISIGAGVVVLIAAIVVGYVSLRPAADDFLVKKIEAFAAGLPEGQTLTWESLSANPVTVSVEIKNPVYRDTGSNVEITADNAVLGVGSVSPFRVDVTLDNPVVSPVEVTEGEARVVIRAKTSSLGGIDLGWFEALSRDAEKDESVALDMARWRTFNQGPLVVDDLSATVTRGDERLGALFLDSLKTDDVKDGVLKSVTLSGVKVSVPSSELEQSLETETLEDVDLAWFVGLAGKMDSNTNPEAVLFDPDLWATFTMGPSTLSNLVSVQDGVRLTLEQSRSEGVKNGRAGRTIATNMAIDSDLGETRIGKVTYDGIDLVRLMALLEGMNVRGKEPSFTVAGLKDFSVENASFTLAENPKAVFSFKRVGLIDVKESAAGVPLAATFVVDDLAVPVSEIDELKKDKVVQRLDLKTLKASAKLAVAFEEKAKQLTVNPLKVDLGELGAAQMTLDLSGFDPRLLKSASNNPMPFLAKTQFNGVSLTVEAGAKTAKALDVLLEENGRNREGLLTMIRGDMATGLVPVLGSDLGGQLTGAAASFVERPTGTFNLSIASKGTPASFKDFVEGGMGNVKKTLNLYNIKVSHAK